MTTRCVPLSALTPSPFNPREIDDAALRGLGASIERFGLVQPIIWNERTGHVIGGHQRLKILQAEDATETDVVVLDLSATEEKALCLALNNPFTQGRFTEAIGAILSELQAQDPETAEALRFGDLMSEMAPPTSTDDGFDSGEPAERFAILVDVATEEDQHRLLTRFQKEGLRCKAYIL
ncbi:MAG TPA: ParB N-terminal domain-containing protein [Phycisphaerae bacterium]|nr:ParB N-terminal domain-containing protein [Phycisphaerae bacterium]